MGPITVVAGPFGEQAGHLPRFVFKTPHEVTVLGVSRLVDQADGHRLVVVPLVARTLCQQSRDFLMLARQVGILNDEFANALQAVVETGRDIRHLPFRGGIPGDVVMDRNVRRGIAGEH